MATRWSWCRACSTLASGLGPPRRKRPLATRAPWSVFRSVSAVEFEVDSVGPAAEAIGERGWQIAQAPKQEPWGQESSRFFLPSGMLGGITETPWARRLSQEQQAEAEA